MRKLTVEDIKDLREYERERDDFRRYIIDLKKRRRVALGTIMSMVFENTDTMRWQVQEMARAERMLRDEQIAHEVDTYNDLIPDDGELSGTLFIEIDDPQALRRWLPRLTHIQDHVRIEGPGWSVPAREVAEERLTREEEITSTVHYLRFAFRPEQAAAVATGPVAVVVDHPNYQARTDLGPEVRAELAADLGLAAPV
ncbi:MAG: DUF3501 family protein [Firmicutes bacterium]|nr:DUF3501 family protein [Bacillota bacterium]